MKQIKNILLLIVAAAMIAACAHDDDPTPAQGLEGLSLSLVSGTTGDLVQAPAAIVNSSDEHAMMVNGYVSAVNRVCTYMSYLHPPAEAEKSNKQIKVANSRVASTAEYLVYSWTLQDMTIAYQVSQQDGKNVFEVFTKAAKKQWVPFLYAEETADGKQGRMNIYGADSDALAFAYSWARNGDLLNLTAMSAREGANLEIAITIHTKSREGSAECYLDAVKTYSLTWDPRGNGTWTKYKENGAVAGGGAWKV